MKGWLQKMKKRISIIYELCLCLAMIFLVYLICFSKTERYTAGGPEGFIKLEDHSYQVQEDPQAPVGIREIYEIHPSEIPPDSNALIFRTVHQNVEVYLDDRLVLRLKKDGHGSLGSSPGNCWNTVLISFMDQGKEIRVEIQPVYSSMVGYVPDFYAGSRFSIYMEILRQDYSAMLLSMAAVILGLGFMAFSAYSCRHFVIDRGLFMMGQFAVLIGVWKMADTGLFGMLTRREDIDSYVAFLALLLLLVPFIQYIRELFSSKSHWIWNLSCILSLSVFLISMGMQVLGIADLREMLWLNHLSMLFIIAVIFPMLYLEVRTTGWSQKLKALVICMGSCLAGLGADIFIYYLSGGVNVTNLGMLAFLIYIVVLGVMSLQDAKRLMTIGMQAKHLEQMAYHDQMTGLYNRAAYADDTEREDFAAKDSIILMFDLNNLKYCNDTFGHDKGDLYIISCAAMIRQVFESSGRCYRVGGDEFCVLLRHKTLEECEKMVQHLKKETEEWNCRHQEKFKAQIAAGYAMYDGELDYDIGDTRRRADKMMYKDKYQMKQGQEGSDMGRSGAG